MSRDRGGHDTQKIRAKIQKHIDISLYIIFSKYYYYLLFSKLLLFSNSK